MLALMLALSRRRAERVFGDSGQFKCDTSFLAEVTVSRDASMSSVVFTKLLGTSSDIRI